MIIADGIFYFIFVFILAFSESNTGVILSFILAFVSAVIFTDIEKNRFVGRILQVITSGLMSVSVFYIIEVFTTDPQTTAGAMMYLYRGYPFVFFAAFLLLTGGLSWLHFIFISLDKDPLSSLFARIIGRFRRVGEKARETVNSHKKTPAPTVEMLRDELDKYHASFTRLKLLIDEVTRSDAFRAGGDIAFDSISSAMDMVRKNNSEVESLYEKFMSADNAERRNILAYIYGVNHDMLNCEDELRKAFEELKANYIPGSEKRRESSSSDSFRRKRNFSSSSGPTTNEERVSMFFNGCESREQLEKRYKSLAKTFHPDMESGDTETMALINREYDRLMEILE